MSLITNKENIFIMSPNNKYADEFADWSNFMENDFTIYLRSKVLLDEMECGTRAFMFSRNGKHCGISTYKDDSENLHVSLTYWFWEKKSKSDSDELIPIQKTITYCHLPELKYKYNDYIIQCSHKERKMWFYVNSNLIDCIDYNELDKYSYEEYMWLGCGNMVTQTEEHKNIGNYEYELFFCLNKNIDVEEVYNIKNNYKEKYIKNYLDLEILNNKIPYKDNIFFFLDFNKKTKYKLWNLAFNGHYPNFYIENNTIF